MKKYFSLLSLIALVVACVDNPTAEDQSAELNWGTAALCIENPIAPGDSLCYHIEFKLDTLAGESELAKRLSEVLRDSVIYTGDYSTVQQAIQAFADSTEAEWKQLADAFAHYVPSFTATIANEKQLSEQEWRVCLLQYLDFSTGEAAILLDTTSQAVTNAKSRANQKLFSEEKASTLGRNLKKIAIV